MNTQERQEKIFRNHLLANGVRFVATLISCLAFLCPHQAWAELVEIPAPPAAAEPQPAMEQINYGEENGKYQLYFPTPSQTGLAIFKLGNKWWLVFDKKLNTNLPDKVLFSSAIQSLDPVPLSEASPDICAFQLILKPNITFTITKKEKGWALNLSFFDETDFAPSTVPLITALKFEEAEWPSATVSNHRAQKEVLITLEGKRLYILPNLEADGGLNKIHKTPYYQIHSSRQGFVCDIFSDLVSFNKQGHQLFIKPSLPKAFASPCDSSASKSFFLRFLDTGEIKNWANYKNNFLNYTAAQPHPYTVALELQRAWIEVALGNGEEAALILATLSEQNPGIEYNTWFKALESMAHLLRKDYKRAVEACEQLPGTKEVKIWKAIAEAFLGDPELARGVISEVPTLLEKYPVALQQELLELIFPLAGAIGLGEVLDRLNDIKLSPQNARLKSIMTYYHAKRLQSLDSAVAALMLFQETAQSHKDNPAPPFILFYSEYEILMEGMKNTTISVQDVIAKLSALRFKWRDGAFEYRVIKKLCELLHKEKHYLQALEYIKELRREFPERSYVDLMESTLQTVLLEYLKQDLTKLSPLEVISVHENYKDFIPPTLEGEAAIDKIVEQFISIDLLDQAAELLNKSVAKAPDSNEKYIKILRIAEIHSSNRKYETVLTLLSSLPSTLPPELADKSLYYKAKAIAKLGRKEEALGLLNASSSPLHLKLASEIYTEDGQWEAAAQKLKELNTVLNEEKDKELKQESLLNLAIVYYLTSQQTELHALEEKHKEFMQGNKLFEYLVRIPLSEITNREDVATYLQDYDQLMEAMREKIEK